MRALSDLGRIVRRVDPDRYLCTLFAPARHRETLFALYAFNHELARAWEVASLPPLALIRLQWWREVVEGVRRSHEVATPLAAELAAGRLDAATLLALIDAREQADAADLPAWKAHVGGIAGGLAVAAGRVLGAEDPRLHALGTGYGVAGQLRNIAPLAGRGRCALPDDLLEQHGLSREEVIARPDDPRLQGVRAALAIWGRALLGPPHPIAPAAIPAALVGVLGRRDLASAASRRGVGDRLAVVWAAMAGRA